MRRYGQPGDDGGTAACNAAAFEHNAAVQVDQQRARLRLPLDLAVVTVRFLSSKEYVQHQKTAYTDGHIRAKE